MQTLSESTTTARPEAALKPSPEVKGLMIRFYEVASSGDFVALDKFLSHQTGVLWIGTDPDEWWDNPPAVLQAWRQQTAELGGPAPITAGRVTAYQHGDVAWVSDRPTFHLPNGKTLPFRLTAVWQREPEGWRIIQVHISLAVPNEEAVRH